MRTRLAVLALVALAAFAPSATADETTFCNAYITSLPYTITTQGHYCFNRNLSTAITTGNAITVNSHFVLIDLNNFKLGGGSAGMGTLTNGIYADGFDNITVRNGNIRGFHAGVRIENGVGHLIENLLVDFNTVIGLTEAGSSSTAIGTEGTLGVVRGNTVEGAWDFGLVGGVCRDNIVSNVANDVGFCSLSSQNDIQP
jgi:hypothetical protein